MGDKLIAFVHRYRLINNLIDYVVFISLEDMDNENEFERRCPFLGN